MLALDASTCSCSPEVPWFCDHCIAARRIHREVIKLALVEVRAHKLTAQWLAEHRCKAAPIAGTDILNCVCEVVAPLHGIELYRSALAKAKRWPLR